jgi:hypothetical protein
MSEKEDEYFESESSQLHCRPPVPGQTYITRNVPPDATILPVSPYGSSAHFYVEKPDEDMGDSESGPSRQRFMGDGPAAAELLATPSQLFPHLLNGGTVVASGSMHLNAPQFTSYDRSLCPGPHEQSSHVQVNRRRGEGLPYDIVPPSQQRPYIPGISRFYSDSSEKEEE